MAKGLVIATRGPKTGRCNACGESGTLTEDHTPPKGCYKPTQVELQSLFRRLSEGPTKDEPRSRRSQNGVKYRTLCARCNNALLGATYDPPFIRFVNQVARIARSDLALPPTLSVVAQPQAILRSLLGHMSAQGVDRYEKGPLTEEVRRYLLDKSLPLPAPIKVFFWLYPHRSHVMVRDASYLDAGQGKPFAFWLLKFFPLAFMVAWGEPGQLPFAVHDLHVWREMPFEAEVELSMRLHSLPPEHWPEAPLENTILAYGPEAISVVPSAV